MIYTTPTLSIQTPAQHSPQQHQMCKLRARELTFTYEFWSISLNNRFISVRLASASSLFLFVRSILSARKHFVTSRLISLHPPIALTRKPRAWHLSRSAITSSQPIFSFVWRSGCIFSGELQICFRVVCCGVSGRSCLQALRQDASIFSLMPGAVCTSFYVVILIAQKYSIIGYP